MRSRTAMRSRTTALLLLLILALSVSTAAAQERIMVGEDIYVAAGEDLDDVVCIGCSIRIDGKVNDAVAIAGSIEMSGEARDAVSIFGGTQVDGEVTGDAVVVGGGLKINGKVHGDAVSVLGGMELGPGAEVDGDTVAVLGGIAGKTAAKIGGAVHESEALRTVALSGAVVLFLLIVAASLLAGPFITFVAVAILGEQRVETIQQTVSQRAGMSFLIGLAVWFTSIVVPITMFWAPGVETLVTISFFVVASVGYAGIGLWVGRGLINSTSVMAPAVFGSGLVGLIQLIPVIGWFIAWPIFGLLALGAAALSGFGTSVDWMLRRSEAEPVPRPTA